MQVRRLTRHRLSKVRLFLETPLFILYALAFHSGRLSIIDAFTAITNDNELCSLLKSYCGLGRVLKKLIKKKIDPATALARIAKESAEPARGLLISYAQILRISGDLATLIESWSQGFVHRVEKFINERSELVNTLLEVVVLSATMLMLSILFLNLGNPVIILLVTALMAVLLVSIGVMLRTPSMPIYIGIPDTRTTIASLVCWASSIAGFACYIKMGLPAAITVLVPGAAASAYIGYRIRTGVKMLDEVSEFLEILADEVRSGVRLDTQIVLQRLQANPRLLALSYVLRRGVEPSFKTNIDPLTNIVKKFLAVLVRSGAEASRAIMAASTLLARARTFTSTLNNRGLLYEAILVLAVVVMIASIRTYCLYMSKPIINGLNLSIEPYAMSGLENLINVPSPAVLKMVYFGVVAVIDAAAAAIASVTRSSPLLALAPPFISMGAIAASMLTLA